MPPDTVMLLPARAPLVALPLRSRALHVFHPFAPRALQQQRPADAPWQIATDYACLLLLLMLRQLHTFTGYRHDMYGLS